MTAVPTAKPSIWHVAKSVDLVSYDNDSVWTLDVRLESGERMAIAMDKIAILKLARSLAEWRQWVGSSPTGRRSFAKPGAK